MVQLPMSRTAKYVSRKSLASIIGLVIGRTKHCYIKVIFSITKPSVITLFVKAFLLVKKVTSNYFLFYTSHIRYLDTYKLTKLCGAPVSMSIDRSNPLMETSR